MTFPSETNILISGAGNTISTIDVNRLHIIIIPMAVENPFLILSVLPAPKFWAKKAFMALPNPSAVVKEMDSIWLPTFWAALAASPQACLLYTSRCV